MEKRALVLCLGTHSEKCMENSVVAISVCGSKSVLVCNISDREFVSILGLVNILSCCYS